MRAPAALPTVLGLALVLAGCTAPAQPPGDDPGPSLLPSAAAAGGGGQGQAGGGAGSAAAGGAPVRFFDGPPVAVELWANGTLRPEQAATPHDAIGMALPTASPRVVTDLTQYVPRGVPVVVELEVDAAMAQGDLDLWVQAAPDAVWTWETDTPYGGSSRVRVALVNGGDPVEAVLYYDVLEPGTELPYTLRIAVQAHPGVMVAGVPYGVPLQPGQRLDVQLLDGEGEAALLVFGPDDALLARVAAEGQALAWAVPVDAPEGEYVVLLAEGSPHGHASVVGAAEPVLGRPMPQAIQAGQPQSFAASEAAEWTFTALRAPLQVGFLFIGGTVAVNSQASLEGPEGELIAWEFDGGPWLFPGFGSFTDVGVPGLAAGTYTVRASYDVAAGEGVEAVDYQVTYAR